MNIAHVFTIIETRNVTRETDTLNIATTMKTLMLTWALDLMECTTYATPNTQIIKLPTKVWLNTRNQHENSGCD